MNLLEKIEKLVQEQPDHEYCFYVPGKTWLQDMATPDGRSSVYGKTLEEMKLENPDVVLIPYSEASKLIDAAIDKMATEPAEITAEAFEYALCELPPVRYGSVASVSHFAISEMITGDMAMLYFKDHKTGKCYHCVDHLPQIKKIAEKIGGKS